jgi:hypothetical protein
MKRLTIGLVTLLALVLIASACASAEDEAGGEAPNTVTSTAPPDDGEAAVVSAFPAGPSALDTMTAPEFPEPLIDPADVMSGGPPPDGIPSIDNPTFVPVVDNIDLLPPEEAVVALEINGDARAYPVRAMIWHEIVNDVVGGVPVSITYCPLCNSAATYERTIDGNVTTFGTSGRLYFSALVMYDRATESLWTHFDGRAVIGVLTGRELVSHASPLISWESFIESYPTGQVLDWEAAGFSRDYGRNPYSGYDTPDNEPFLFRGALDDRAKAMQRVIGIGSGPDAKAYTIQAISGTDARTTDIVIGGEPAVIFWIAGQASALESGTIDGGRDVGNVGVFRPEIDGVSAIFSVENGAIVDDISGSTWSPAGVAVSGPLVGTKLEAVPHLDTFWFAWSTYQPDTTLVDE